MSVSVIIPFYNANKYLSRAIDSCLIQDEVGQIILVDDGSTDYGPEIASLYEKQHNRINLLRHKQNKGRSNARNTGFAKTDKEFVAFLDADDYFLPKRFSKAIQCLKSNPDVDGTYEIVRSEYTTDELKGEGKVDELTGIQKLIDPHNLFEYLVLGKGGHISLIGCLFRTESIKGIPFDSALEIGEDTDFLWRTSQKLKLLKASDHHLIIRTVHGGNSYFNEDLVIENKVHLYKKWLDRCIRDRLSTKVTRRVLRSFLYYSQLSGCRNGLFGIRFFLLLKTLFQQPKVLLRIL